jgi:hypothetical protein
MKSRSRLTVCLLAILIASCANTSATECSWVRLIQTSGSDVLTQGTKRQIVKHNRKVEEFCR